jgi:16S rRNA (guanine527-N7)-methyltransferase
MVDILFKYFSDFTEVQIEQFKKLEPLYKEWNEKINVISRKDIDGLYEKHVLHSLSIAAMCNFADGANIIDLGCGGGFPGIPLAIFFPNVKFHLVDSINKKLTVVQNVAEDIGLTNVTTQHSRVEDIKDRKVDFVISRAVAPLKDLWEWSKPLINKRIKSELPNGLICLKGGNLALEISNSGCKVNLVEITEIFKEEFFKEKFFLHVKA